MDISIAKIISLIKKPASSSVLDKGRALKQQCNLIFLGDGYLEDLKQRRFNRQESDTLFAAKMKFCVPKTPALFNKIDRQFKKVFRADGFNQTITFKSDSEEKTKQASAYLDTIYNGRGLRAFMREHWSVAIKDDFNGIYIVETAKELDDEGKAVPQICFYSIDKIKDIVTDDHIVQYVIVAHSCPEYSTDNGELYWRYIDSDIDVVFKQIGDDITLNNKANGATDLISNQLGYVPAIKISTYIHSMQYSDLRINHLFHGVNLAAQYQDVCDDSVVNMKKHGNPLFYSRQVVCPKCEGAGELPYRSGMRQMIVGEIEVGQLIPCYYCNGEKQVSLKKGDPTEGIIIPSSSDPDRVGEEARAPCGYVEPATEPLLRQREEVATRKGEVEESILGASGMMDTKVNINESGLKTIVDKQPLLDTLDEYRHNISTVYNFLAKVCLDIHYGEDFVDLVARWGSAYLLKTYEEAMVAYGNTAGMPDSIRKEALTEATKIKFENNPSAQARALFLIDLEPFPTYVLKDCVDYGIATKLDLAVKQYFNDLVEEFERENGDILEYKKSYAISDKLDEIQQYFADTIKEWGIDVTADAEPAIIPPSNPMLNSPI